MLKLIQDLDRRMMETLDRMVLFVWNKTEIKWLTQVRILSALYLTFGIIPHFVAIGHFRSVDYVCAFGILFYTFTLSLRTDEMHNAYVTLHRSNSSFRLRIFIWFLFILGVVGEVFPKDVRHGVWMLELSNCLWLLSMFFMDTYRPTKPPQRRKREKRVAAVLSPVRT